MLLDETLTTASDSESSLAEGSFDNGQDGVLLDQVREFEPQESGIEEADQQIYADQGFNYIPPEQRTTQRVTPKKEDRDKVLQRAREISQQQKAQEQKKKKAVTDAAKSAVKKKSRTESQMAVLDKAKEKSEKSKQKKKKAEAEQGEDQTTQQSRLDKYKPDVGRLAHDATHGDPRQIMGDLADQYFHAGRRVGDALFITWIVMTIITSLSIIGGILSLLMLNLLLIAPNWNYRITRWLLEFILDFFGVGEVLTVTAQFGLTKVDVKLSGLEKGGIIAFDFIILIILMALLTLVITIFCYPATINGGSILVSAAAWWYNLPFLTGLVKFCTLSGK